MDPRDRADALLARARSRGAFVVTPDNMTSPMDASSTQQISRAVVSGLDPDTTTQLPASLIEENDHPLAAGTRTQPSPHPLAQPTPTRPLEAPGPQGSNAQTAPQPTIPQPAAPASQTTTPLAPRPQAKPVSSPLRDPAEEEMTGLVPTVKQTTGKSNLSRRLDGL
ncbi:hypothetical protein [Amycolatopsis benzoatilytica]|uniref:hypothetical protein n=1 Tax=Amycolatopsis benzoatilytica TaxID=346045 RepID=UPI0003705C3B|nr:hypothetical protein [Amycolatopsis benzoatilytica]